MSWRNDLASITKRLTGRSFFGWRANAKAVADHYGLARRDWRSVINAVRAASQLSLGSDGWTAGIRVIAAANGEPPHLQAGWRKSLRFLIIKGSLNIWDDDEFWDDDDFWWD